MLASTGIVLATEAEFIENPDTGTDPEPVFDALAILLEMFPETDCCIPQSARPFS
jgi:hypothetical protein